jgi:hypothetical protein
MDRPVARIGRKNFIDNLIARLPVITTLYVIQCFFVYQFAKDINLGDFAMWLGLGLITFASFMMFFEKFHQVLLFKDHLIVHFKVIGLTKKIPYALIKDIIVPNEEYKFSTITLVLMDDSEVHFLFADYPVRSKKFILDLINKSHSLESDEDKAA